MPRDNCHSRPAADAVRRGSVIGLGIAAALAMATMTLAENAAAGVATTPDPAALCRLSLLDWIDISGPADAQSLATGTSDEIDLGVLAAAPDDAATLARLRELAGGRPARLLARPSNGASDPARDRYGRLVAPVVLAGGSGPVWLQAVLVAEGLSRVAPPVVDTAELCLPALLELEDAARRSGRGHWGSARFRVLPATDPAAIALASDRFTIVEGRIRRASVSRGRVYLNFGRDWRRDFTVRIPVRALGKRARTSAAAAGNPDSPGGGATTNDPIPEALRKGRQVRVRGYVELRGGPLIEIEDIDLVEPLPSPAR